MHLTDLNPHGGIGSNALLAEIGPFRLLIDCGMHPKEVGRPSLPDLRWTDQGGLDFIILTHCHLDHVGALPVALRHHPGTQILASPASATLAPRMLRNSVNVMKRQRDELGVPELPLYTMREIAMVEKALHPIFFSRTFELWKGSERLDLTLHPAGHIAGAASVEIVYRKRRIVFSGDLLFENQMTLAGAKPIQGKIDSLVLETTRGATERGKDQTRQSELDRLFSAMLGTLERGGSVLIPVFALGRMQEMMSLVHNAFRHGILPTSPVYATGLGMDLVNYLHKIARREKTVRFTRRIVTDLKVRPIPDRLRPGQDLPEPGICLLSSGMMVAKTPSYRMATSLLGHERNSIYFVGYCDPDTPGSHLQGTRPGESFLFDDLDLMIPARATIDRFDLSGHADRDELCDYAHALDPRAIVLNHGDPEARDWFKKTLTPEFPTVIDPEPLVRFEV